MMKTDQFNEEWGITIRVSSVEVLGALDSSSFCRVVGLGSLFQMRLREGEGWFGGSKYRKHLGEFCDREKRNKAISREVIGVKRNLWKMRELTCYRIIVTRVGKNGWWRRERRDLGKKILELGTSGRVGIVQGHSSFFVMGQMSENVGGSEA